MEASYQLPTDEEAQRAVELVLRWPAPLRGEGKLAWLFLVSRAGMLAGEVRVHPAEIGASQGHDTRAGFRALHALVAERLVHKTGVDRGFWLLRLRHPAHVIRERVADQTMVSPQLMLPFMRAEDGQDQSGGETPRRQTMECDLAGRAERADVAGSAGALHPAQAPREADFCPPGEGYGAPHNGGACLTNRQDNADAAPHPHSAKYTSNLKHEFIPASNLNFTLEVSEEVEAKGTNADAAPHPQRAVRSGFRPEPLRRPDASATGPRPIGAVLAERNLTAAEQGQKLAACMRWLAAAINCPQTQTGALRKVAQQLVAGRLSRQEIGDLAAYVNRHHAAGTLTSPTKSGAFFRTCQKIFDRESLPWGNTREEAIR